MAPIKRHSERMRSRSARRWGTEERNRGRPRSRRTRESSGTRRRPKTPPRRFATKTPLKSPQKSMRTPMSEAKLKKVLKEKSKHAAKRKQDALARRMTDKRLNMMSSKSQSSDSRLSHPSNSTHCSPSRTQPEKSEATTKSIKKARKSRSKTHFTHRKRSNSQAKLKLHEEGLKGSKSMHKLPKLRRDPNESSMSGVKAAEGLASLHHVEVCAKPASTARVAEVKNRVKTLLRNHPHDEYTIPFTRDSYLRENIETIIITPPETDYKGSNKKTPIYQIHVYQQNCDGSASDDWEEDDMATAKHWILPNIEFAGLWDNLIFDSQIKNRLLNYAQTTLMYTKKNVDRDIISCNRVVLLHGPPGTGKTSLCRALAHKLCIRMSHKYRYGQLVEINSHGLFSKWFSESGKLVVKMFQKIQEFIDNKETLVCVLIDEVESLTAARKHMMNGNEPSDSIRVVNAMLTQLDQIRRYPNVLVLTTSNVTGQIDLAFLDRADITQYIQNPNQEAIYTIYRDCIMELMKKEIIGPPVKLLSWKALTDKKTSASATSTELKHSNKLKVLSVSSVGLSGRLLRKLPMLAHTDYLQAQNVDLNSFLDAMIQRVRDQFRERKAQIAAPDL